MSETLRDLWVTFSGEAAGPWLTINKFLDEYGDAPIIRPESSTPYIVTKEAWDVLKDMLGTLETSHPADGSYDDWVGRILSALNIEVAEEVVETARGHFHDGTSERCFDEPRRIAILRRKED